MSTVEAIKTSADSVDASNTEGVRGHLTLKSLQYLRGVAALLVVYFHAVLQLKSVGIFKTSLPLFGESGVDLFFVLSGFLMWATTTRTKTTPLSFFRKRLIRIAPLYWGLTLAAGAVAMLAPQLLKNTKFDSGHFIASLLFVPAMNPSYREGMALKLQLTPILVPGWTLNYEMFFYLIFALFVMARPVQRLIGVAAALLILVLAGASNRLGDGVLVFYGNPIVLEFVFGIAIAVLVERGTLLKPRVAMALLLIGSPLLIWADLMHAPFRVVMFGVPAALVVYALCCLELGSPLKSLPLLKALGDASYSIYLTHIFSLAACRLMFISVQPQGGVNELAFIIVGLCVSALIGLMTYSLYEKPAMYFLRRFK